VSSNVAAAAWSAARVLTAVGPLDTETLLEAIDRSRLVMSSIEVGEGASIVGRAFSDIATFCKNALVVHVARPLQPR